MRELERLLSILEPPAGGLARLRQRIESERSRRRPPVRLRWLWAAACVPVAVLAVWMPGWIAQRQQAAAMNAALRQGMSPSLPENGIRVANGAAIELPSGQANVRLYLVAATEPAKHR